MLQLNGLKYDGIIAFSGFSEPLLHPDINKFIALARSSCSSSRIELYTNGDALTIEKLVGLFESGLSSIHVSLYDGSEQNELFIEMTKKAGLTHDRVILRERYLEKDRNYGITLSNRSGMIDLDKSKRELPLYSECYYPFYMMFVHYTGDVLLCSHDWGKKLILGNLYEQEIFDVWNGNLINAIRGNLSSKDRTFLPCSRCDVKGVLMGKEHFDYWNRVYNK